VPALEPGSQPALEPVPGSRPVVALAQGLARPLALARPVPVAAARPLWLAFRWARRRRREKRRG